MKFPSIAVAASLASADVFDALCVPNSHYDQLPVLIGEGLKRLWIDVDIGI